MADVLLDQCDRAILNRMQSGIPICDRPFAALAGELGIDEQALLARLQRLLDEGALTRFGPLYRIERAGGAFVLAAMRVPHGDVERVAAIVNARPEVAHNYLREHPFNLWFVVATSTPGHADRVITKIEIDTGYPVYAMPKLKEYFLDLRLAV